MRTRRTAGPAHRAAGAAARRGPRRLRRPGPRAATASGSPRNWAHPVELAPGITATVPRGRGIGGSGAINGAAWTYATPADAMGWGIPGWSYPMLRYWYTIAAREP